MVERAVRKAASAISRVSSFSAQIAAGVIIFIMLLITADVIGRYFFLSPIPGAFEAGEASMVVIVFLAYAHAEARGHHIRIRFIEARLTPRQLLLLDILAGLIGIFVFSMIGWQAWGQAWLSLSVNERAGGMARFPLYPARFVLMLGCFLLVLQFLAGLATNLGKIVKS